jgi:spermidine/putrescine transport system substrate-binding protein
MLDDLYETIGAALVYLGYSPNDSDPAHLEQAKNLLIMQKKYLWKYASADLYIPNMVNPRSTNYWVSHVWNGDLYTSKESNPNLRYVLPEEGGIWWIDNMVIPKGAPHPVAAHAWINFMSNPMVATINSEKIHYANPNRVANEKLLPKSVVQDRNLYPTAEDLEKFELGKMFSEEESLRFEEVWIAVKIAPTG